MKNYPRGPNFRAPNRSIYRFSSIFLKCFCHIHLKLDLQTHWNYFCRCVKERHQRPKFWASKWVKFQLFEYFVETFGLDSHQSCFICALELLSEMCEIWASKAQLLGHFGPQSKKNFSCLVTFSKSFHWFHNSIASHAHSKYFMRCGEYGPQRPNFWATLVPQISKNSGLWSFSQKFPTGCTSVLMYMSTWATFRGVFNIGPRGTISGSFWAPNR